MKEPYFKMLNRRLEALGVPEKQRGPLLIRETKASNATPYNWLSGKKTPGREYSEKIDAFLKREEAKAGIGPASGDFLDVPQLISGGEAKPPIIISRQAILNRGINPDLVRLHQQAGQSMAPLYSDQCWLWINTEDTEPRDGRAYAVEQKGLVRIKILHLMPGYIRAASANPDKAQYPDERLEGDYKIIGRVFHHSSWEHP